MADSLLTTNGTTTPSMNNTVPKSAQTTMVSRNNNSNTLPTQPSARMPLTYTHPYGKIDHEKLAKFSFTSPEMCPVFYPTVEEFALGPLEYINQIRPEAEKYGICKIVVPKEHETFPFSINIEEFRFSPRVQRLNELEAKTRTNLNFHERVWKFWELQGISIKFPQLEKRCVDLFELHNIVKEEQGFEICSRDKKWPKITTRMNFTNSKSTCNALRQYYERLLFPYDIYLSGATLKNKTTVENEEVKVNDENDTSKDIGEKNRIDNSELKKLQTYGAGPRMPGVLEFEEKFKPKPKCCQQCNGRKNYTSSVLLTCDKCSFTTHKSCLIQPLNDTPKSAWHCPNCIRDISAEIAHFYSKGFGFTQSSNAYTLMEFKEMADKFKREYFDMEPNDVPPELVEKEFWRILHNGTPGGQFMNVEYGADLHTNDYGSGFPTKKNDIDKSLSEFVNSPWNLNNLPTLNGSVFKHINTNINGMIIPWMYVGMCFSAFCWHNEDHWTYSINYLHWGEPKIWYGVPGDKAEDFEQAMEDIAPELFASQPDLLHQLVTTCNPNLLKDYNVPIYKAVQEAGQFIVTFPRSYHSGFNQGINFAEAVNFAPHDWLKIGRQSIDHYKKFHRYPVFSHDELICKMADNPRELQPRLAKATYEDLTTMIENEEKERLQIIDQGVNPTNHILMENKKDDERQCDYCKTTCFLSALICECSTHKMVCLSHFDYLCETCPVEKFSLVYRYSIEELKLLKFKLNEHILKIEKWTTCMGNLTILPINGNSMCLATNRNRDMDKKTYTEIRELMEFAQTNNIEDERNKPVLKLTELFHEATILSEDVRKLLLLSQDEDLKPHQRITISELKSIVNRINNCPCLIENSEELLKMLKEWQNIESEISNCSDSRTNVDKLKSLLHRLKLLQCINFDSEALYLKNKIEEAEWYISYKNSFEDKDIITEPTITNLILQGIDLSKSNVAIHEKIQGLSTITQEYTFWLKQTQNLFNPRQSDCKPSLESFVKLIDYYEKSSTLKRFGIQADYTRLRKVVTKANTCELRAKNIFSLINKSNSYDGKPTLNEFENLYVKTVRLKCKLDYMESLEKIVVESEKWVKRIQKIIPNIHSFTLEPYDDGYETEQIKQDYDNFIENKFLAFKESRNRLHINKRKVIEDNEVQKYLESSFCYCKKLLDDQMVECQRCLNWFHSKCIVERQLELCLNEQPFYICLPCNYENRSRINSLDRIMTELNSLEVRFPEIDLFKFHRQRIKDCTDKLNLTLSKFPQLKMIYERNSNDISMITDDVRNTIENILLEYTFYNVSIEDFQPLWNLYLTINPKLRTIIPFDSKLKIKDKKIHSKNRYKRTSKLSNNNHTGKRLKEWTGMEDDDDYHYTNDRCALNNNCKRPDAEHLDWVQCDKCKKWFHQICLGFSKSEYTAASYFCKNCIVH